MRRREAKLERTVATLERIEDSRPEKLARTGRYIERELRTREEKFDRSLDRLDAYFANQFTSWEENEESRKRAIEDWAAGNPERAEFAFLCYF